MEPPPHSMCRYYACVNSHPCEKNIFNSTVPYMCLVIIWFGSKPRVSKWEQDCSENGASTTGIKCGQLIKNSKENKWSWLFIQTITCLILILSAPTQNKPELLMIMDRGI